MIRGERFELDLDADELSPKAPAPPVGAFVGDVWERAPPKPPTAPTFKANRAGFPEHRKGKSESRFKQRQAASGSQAMSSPGNVATPSQSAVSGNSPATPGSWEAEEKARIDADNSQWLAEMTPEQIEHEREELMSGLNPAFIQRLLQKSLNDASKQTESSGTDAQNERKQNDPPVILVQPASPPTKKSSKEGTSKKVSFTEPDLQAEADYTDDKNPSVEEALPHDTVHFPRPPQPPELDPSSDAFLQDLHDKYFPSLPADPEKLEWMQMSSNENTYSQTTADLKPNQIRFSFRGELIPPRDSAEISVLAGLHHHGNDPESAGYTIPELALLARSSYPAQRCIAFQTLGRILYRLGKGEFGNSGEPGADRIGEEAARNTHGELARGLWAVVEREQVINLLVLESEGQGVDKGRHQSAKAYATEAVWLWQKGGGRSWNAN